MVKFSHTRYRALGPELIPVYRQVVLSHPRGGRLPLLSAGLVVTFPAEEHHRPSTSTKLYCLVTEAHWCEQLAQGCYSTARHPGIELATTESRVRCIYCQGGCKTNSVNTYWLMLGRSAVVFTAMTHDILGRYLTMIRRAMRVCPAADSTSSLDTFWTSSVMTMQIGGMQFVLSLTMVGQGSCRANAGD